MCAVKEMHPAQLVCRMTNYLVRAAATGAGKGAAAYEWPGRNAASASQTTGALISSESMRSRTPP